MPYESFNRCHRVHVCDIAQDPTTGTWRYVVQVEKSMLDMTDGSNNINTGSPNRKASPTMAPSSKFQASRPEEIESFHSQVYTIERSYAAFKRLHRAMESFIDTDELPKLPDESLMSFFVGETQSLLEKRQYVVESILRAIEDHSAAAQSAAFLDFLKSQDATKQQSYVVPPRSYIMRNRSTHDFRTVSSQVHQAPARPPTSRRQQPRPRLLSLDSNVDKCVDLMRRTTLN